MAHKSRPDHFEEKYLTKTQEVRYQKEFRRADRIYQQHSLKGNRS